MSDRTDVWESETTLRSSPRHVCASTVAARIAEQVEGAIALPNQHGAQIGPDLEVTARTLAGLGTNPNVAAVLVIGLGCESVQAERLHKRLQSPASGWSHWSFRSAAARSRRRSRGSA